MRAETQAIKDKILEAALSHVAFDGWSRKVLDAAAADAGVDPAEARVLFPDGGDDLNRHLDEWADRQMLARLEVLDLEPMLVRDRVKAAVRLRFEALTPHKEAVRRGVTARIWPQNALAGSKAVWRTVDRIWDAAGDTATDYNRYTKRGLLVPVYVGTFLYWLDDRSPDHEATWDFLGRRIDEIVDIGGFPSRVARGVAGLNPFARRGGRS